LRFYSQIQQKNHYLGHESWVAKDKEYYAGWKLSKPLQPNRQCPQS